jgi:hypothetical protein
MAAVIPDQLLEHFVVRGTWDELPGLITDRLDGIAARAIAYFAGMAWQQDPAWQERWGSVARRLND